MYYIYRSCWLNILVQRMHFTERFVDWQQDIKRRDEIKEQRFLRKERTVGKYTYEIGETVRLQNIKSKKWDVFAVEERCCKVRETQKSV